MNIPPISSMPCPPAPQKARPGYHLTQVFNGKKWESVATEKTAGARSFSCPPAPKKAPQGHYRTEVFNANTREWESVITKRMKTQ